MGIMKSKADTFGRGGRGREPGQTIKAGFEDHSRTPPPVQPDTMEGPGVRFLGYEGGRAMYDIDPREAMPVANRKK